MAANFLDEMPKVDWNDFENAAIQTHDALRRLADDKVLLGALIRRAPEDPRLFSMCESDTVEDKIVFYDDPERGMRLRLRMATAQQRELAHTHRFSFTNLVMRGAYRHRNFNYDGEFDEQADRDRIRLVCVHDDQPGHIFSIHHSAIHATPLESAGTISMVFRGPAMKKRAAVVPRGAGRSFSRIGEAEESVERRQLRQMSRELFAEWLDRLTEYRII